MWKIFRQLGKFAHAIEELSVILVDQITDQAISQIPTHFSVLHRDILETEIFIIEGVYQLPHPFDSFADPLTITQKSFRTDIISLKSISHSISPQGACCQRQINPR